MAQRSIISFLTHEARSDGGSATLAQALDARVREGELIEQLPDHAVRCFACGHRCLVKPGRRGICKVRFNQDGTLYVPAGYVAALQCDPTEKKPFFHALPGSDTLTFGMLGCDFHCGYCQNWLTSQALRDDAAGVLPTDVTPDALVRLALGQGAKLVGSSYNEPLIVPGCNDDTAQLRRAAEYLASVSPEIPWHVTAFHKDYKMTDPDDTSAETLVRACEIGAAAGLKFIYAGNLPGRVGRWENTYCPDCGDLLIERYGYVIERNKVAAQGRCPTCGRGIPGVWC